jgi:hypothetical protein
MTNKLTPGPWWFHWSVLGWGIGLAFHFKAVYLTGRQWRDRCMKPCHRRASVIMCAK